MCRRLGGSQGRSGRMQKISSSPGSNSGQSSPYRVAIPTELSRPSPLRPHIKNNLNFVALFPAAYTTCSFLEAASLQSPAGCMRFLFHTSNRTTGSCFLDLRRLQMELLFVALNFGTLVNRSRQIELAGGLDMCRYTCLPNPSSLPWLPIGDWVPRR